MCGTFSPGSAGAMRTTSPGIQPKPAVSPCSRPRLAIICWPTQMPRNGAPPRIARSSIAAKRPGMARSPARQSAKAPTPGSTIRSAARTASGSPETATGPAPVSPAMRWKLFSAECRLPLA